MNEVRGCVITAVANGWLVDTGPGRPWGAGIVGGEDRLWVFRSADELGAWVTHHFRDSLGPVPMGDSLVWDEAAGKWVPREGKP